MKCKDMFRFSILAISGALLVAMVCSLLIGLFTFRTTFICFGCIALGLVFGWACGELRGEWRSEAKWLGKALWRIDGLKIHEKLTVTESARSWNSALNRVAYELKKEIGEDE